MAQAQDIKNSNEKVPASKWRISEDWLATAIGLGIVLFIHLGDITVKWPLFEWFKK